MRASGLRRTDAAGHILITLSLLLMLLTTIVWAASRSVLSGTVVQVSRQNQDAATRYAFAARAMVLKKAKERDGASGEGAWRSFAAAGGFNFIDSPVGRGRIWTKLIDPTGNFSDRNWDTAILVCTGIVSGAVYSFQQVLAPAPSEAMKFALYARDDLILERNILVHGAAYARGDIRNSGGTKKKLAGDGFASGGVIEVTVTGESRADHPAVPIPTPDFTWYESVGTTIPTSEEYEDMLLSPTSNPFGPPNPYGVYIIDADEEDIEFRNVRLVGTLYIKNADGARIELRDGILFEENRPGQMLMLIRGDDETELQVRWSANLSEASATNMNPEGTPYPWRGNGSTDADLNDVYASRLHGFVWCSGDIRVRTDYFSMHGGLISGESIRARGHVGWLSESQEESMIGFQGRGLITRHGTFRQL